MQQPEKIQNVDLELLKNELLQQIDRMDEYQLRFILSLSKKLFRLPD